MKTTPKGQLLTGACLAALCLLFPAEAGADGISFGFVAVAGVVVLLDVSQRKVGRIADGSKFVTLTARYRRNIWNTNK